MITVIADFIVAIGGVTALFGAAGGSVYIAQRKMNGRKVLPESSNGEELDALHAIETAIREGTDQTSNEHASMMHALGYKEGHQWVARNKEQKGT